jgi:hypothetical protein
MNSITILYDLETSDINPNTCEIIECCYYIYEFNYIYFNSLIKN